MCRTLPPTGPTLNCNGCRSGGPNTLKGLHTMSQRKTALSQRAQPTTDDSFLTSAQVGAMLGGSTNSTARELMSRYGVPLTLLGGRYFYPKAAVLELIAKNTIKPVAPKGGK